MNGLWLYGHIRSTTAYHLAGHDHLSRKAGEHGRLLQVSFSGSHTVLRSLQTFRKANLILQLFVLIGMQCHHITDLRTMRYF